MSEIENLTPVKTPILLCPKFETAFEILGKRWTGLILNILMQGVNRFSDIQANVPDLSARMLTERLKDLETHGIIKREVYPETPVRIEYLLTDKGRDLKQAMDEIQAWASKWG